MSHPLDPHRRLHASGPNSAPTDARDEAFLATMQQSPNRMPVWARRRLDEIGEELKILESDAVNAPRGLIDALKQERETILSAMGGQT